MPANPNFDALVEEVQKKIGIEEFNRQLAEMKAMVDKTKEDLEAEKSDHSATKEALDEFRARLAKRERLDTESGFHVMKDGRVRPSVSPECAKALVDTFRAAYVKGERVMSSGTDSEGGYLIAPEYSAEIIRLVPTVGLVARIFRPYPMTSNTVHLGELASSMTAYWVDEATAPTKSYPSFGRLTLTAKILAGLTYGPESLFDDATIDLGNFIADLLIECFAGEQDRVGLVGDVSGASDPFNGIMYATSINSKVMDSGHTGFTNINHGYLLDLQTTVPDGARTGCFYIMNPTVFDYVRKLNDSNGQPIWQRPADGAPGTIWGRPYELSEKLPALSATGASKGFVLYGNPKYAILGTRKTIQVKVSDQPTDAFEKIQLAIRAHMRMAIAVYGGAFAKLVTAAT